MDEKGSFPKKDLGFPNFEAASGVTVRFDIGNAQVNCCLFRQEQIFFVKNNIEADERTNLS